VNRGGRDAAQITAALADAGLVLPAVTPPAADYAPAARTPDTIYTAGQLPYVDGSLVTGRVGGDDGLSVATAAAAARQAALSGIAAALSVVAESELIRPLKVTVFVAAADGFTDMPTVADGASAALGAAFGVPHARSAVGVAELPRNAVVEVEMIFAVAGLG
jgi:enamine deaminase RidA (YjgF/YER057c/UK114 family)